MKVINIFLIISIFTFVDVVHAMDDEYYELDFSRHSLTYIEELKPKKIAPTGCQRKILGLKNITPEKFDLFRKTLEKLESKKVIKKIIYSYDKSLQAMPMFVDKIMGDISSKKRIVIEKEGFKQWPEEQAPKLAELNNPTAIFYQNHKVAQEETESWHSYQEIMSKERRDQKRENKIDSMGCRGAAIEEGYRDNGDGSESDPSDY